MDPSQILAQILAAAGVSAGAVPSNIDLSLGNILRSILILVVVYFVARFVRGALGRTLHQFKFDKRLQQLILQTVYYGIIGLGIIWILGGFGLSVVLLGVAVGFAFKDLIQNFAAGLLIMGTQPFQIGDWVVVGTTDGRVAEIGWRGTFLDTFDGKRVIIPNSTVINSVVINNSIRPELRSSISLTLDINTDFERVEKLILDALKPVKGIAAIPEPAVHIDSLTTTSMNISVLLWISEPIVQQQRVLSYALQAIKQVLANNAIAAQNAPTPSVPPSAPSVPSASNVAQ